MKLVIFVLAVLFSSNSIAMFTIGGSDVGGGKGVVCYDKNNKIKSVELLDLWEGRIIYGLHPRLKSTVNKNIDGALQQLKYSVFEPFWIFPVDNSKQAEAVYGSLQAELEILLDPRFDNVHRVRGVNLQLTDDSYETITPRDCKIEQIAIYKDFKNKEDWEIYLNQDLIDKMDATNKAALYIHEAFYHFLRPQETNSLRIRRIVANIFSRTDTFQNPYRKIPDHFYYCVGGETEETISEVYLIKETFAGKTWITARPSKIQGRYLFGASLASEYSQEGAIDLNGPFLSTGEIAMGDGINQKTADILFDEANGKRTYYISLKSRSGAPAEEKVSLYCSPFTKNDIQ